MSNILNSFFHFIHFSEEGARLKYPFHDFEWMCMKRKEMNCEMDLLLEGRMRRLDGLELREEIDFMENVSLMSGRDRDKVFGE